MGNEPKNTFTNEQFCTDDTALFKLYGELINSAYPSFLKRIGLSRSANSANGAIITDSSGQSFIDCIGGYGLYNIGHNHPRVIQDLIDQLEERQLLTKPFINETQVMLAKKLSEIVPGDLKCSFMCNSGSEAIDNAIKLVRLQSNRKQIITAKNSFHGYTLGALSATGIALFKNSFGPMIPGIKHVPFGDIDALEATINPDTAAVLIEPIQHEAGIAIPPDEYLLNVQSLCNDNNTLFILDEIKTGFGKTGYMFACEEYEIVPDILVVGKSLGGGMIPIGALIAKKKLWRKFSYSFPMSASSFAGNTLACRAALSTIDILRQGNILSDCRKKGVFILEKLVEIVAQYPNLLTQVHGKGLLIGLEVINPDMAIKLSKEMVHEDVLMIPSFGNSSVIIIEPPLIISFDQINVILNALKRVCIKLSSS